MNKNTKVIHPYLFAILPVIFLYSQNVGEVLFKSVFWPLVIILILSAAVLLAVGLYRGNNLKAGLIVTAFWAYFFLYANISGLFRGGTVFGLELYKHSLILPVWTVLYAMFVLVVLKWKYDLVKITKIANVVALCLFLTSSFTIISQSVKNTNSENTSESLHGQSPLELPSPAASIPPSELPDIYYIIPDQHVSNDVLETYFNFDNSAFADGLRQRGFYFAEKSRSNYCQTRLSLASSLNLQYLDSLTARYGAKSSRVKPMIDMLESNRLTQFLKNYGYKTVAFSTGYRHTELKKSDVYFSRGFSLGEFHAKIFSNTILMPFFKHNMTYEGLRKQILFPLENITKVIELDSPVFTFIHIVCPHTPYIFDENGNPISGNKVFNWSDTFSDSIDGRNNKYLGQLKFIDRKITEAIDVILEKSDKPPLIILQSDHGCRWKFGPDSQKVDYRPHFGILNAYYLPGFDQTKLYDSITPVNSFRLILNHYFKTELEPLEDKTYYSDYYTPYDFTDTTEKSDRKTE